MSGVRVRRSGLVAFGIKLGSTITGFAFVLLVTSNLSTGEFGLWQLIGRTITYSSFVNIILGFWTTRYRARGVKLGKTVFAGSLFFSAVLIPVYLVVSLFVAGTVPQVPGNHSNFFFFFLSSPQILLTTLILVPESILWGYRPERASIGFGIFEVVKVAIGAIAIPLLSPHLLAAIIALIGAEVAQLIMALFLARGEFSDRFSFDLIRKMLRNGWLALLNNFHPILISLDFLIVAFFTHSLTTIYFFGAASVFGGVIGYSAWIANGLYASVLSGKDARQSANQVIELQLLFIVPMTIGAIILAPQLMHLLNRQYEIGFPILQVLAVGSGLYGLSYTFDNVIAGSDVTDAGLIADFSHYLNSKLFWLSKINLALAVGYLFSVGLLAVLVAPSSGSNLPVSTYIFLGVLWAMVSLVVNAISLVLKMYYSRRTTPIRITSETAVALSVASIVFGSVLYYLSTYVIHPLGGEIQQASSLLLLGGLSLILYAFFVLLLSRYFRQISKAVLASIVSM